VTVVGSWLLIVGAGWRSLFLLSVPTSDSKLQYSGFKRSTSINKEIYVWAPLFLG
jgi:hypothetical protein